MVSDADSCVNVCAERRIEELLFLPRCEGYCQSGGRPAHLHNKIVPGQQRVVRFACKSWACRVCGAYLRRKYGLHYAMCAVRSSGYLYSQVSPPDEWPREKKRLQRAGAEWVRIGAADKGGWLLVSAAASAERRVYRNAAAAVRELGHELRALQVPPQVCGKRFRPHASSPGWKVPKKPPKYEHLGWVSVNDPVSVVGQLVALGVERAAIKTRAGVGLRMWDVVFDCAPGLHPLIAEVLGTIWRK